MLRCGQGRGHSTVCRHLDNSVTAVIIFGGAVFRGIGGATGTDSGLLAALTLDGFDPLLLPVLVPRLLLLGPEAASPIDPVADTAA